VSLVGSASLRWCARRWGEDADARRVSGMVGSLFTTGAVAIALAACLRAWHSPSANRLWSRVFAVLVALAAVVAAVNLPILVGWQIFGRTWFAEEVGVLVTAPLAMLLGQRWLRSASVHHKERDDSPGTPKPLVERRQPRSGCPDLADESKSARRLLAAVLAEPRPGLRGGRCTCEASRACRAGSRPDGALTLR
jgi:hypothetical protein